MWLPRPSAFSPRAKRAFTATIKQRPISGQKRLKLQKTASVFAKQ
jgi:hypothetical protein